MVKFGNIGDLETDADLEKKIGINLDLGEGRVIRILRAGGHNTAFGKTLELKLKPYKFQIQNGTLADDIDRRIMAEVYADACVIGWSGIRDDDGNEVPYSKENARALLTQSSIIYDALREEAQKSANFRRLDIERKADALKNESAGS